MKDTKSFDKWIGILSISVISIVAIVFVVIISDTHLAKGTYGASNGFYVLDAGSTYTLPSEITAYEDYTCQITEYTSCSGLSGYRAKKSCWSCVEESALTCWCNDFSHECSWSSSTPGALYYAVTDASQAVSSCGAKPSGQMVTNYYLSDTKPTNGTCTSKAYSSCSGVSGYFAMNCFLCTKTGSGTESEDIVPTTGCYACNSGIRYLSAGSTFPTSSDSCNKSPVSGYSPDGNSGYCSKTSDNSGDASDNITCTYSYGFIANTVRVVKNDSSCKCPSQYEPSTTQDTVCIQNVSSITDPNDERNIKFQFLKGGMASCPQDWHLYSGSCVQCKFPSEYTYDGKGNCIKSTDTPSTPSNTSDSCAAGSYCKGQGVCETCLAGYYCPGVTSGCMKDSSRSGITRCPSGTTSVAGSDASSDCKSSGGDGTTPGGNGGDSTPGSSTDTGACYLVNHKYVWSANSLSGGTLVNSITSKSNCSGCEKGYTLNSSNNCVKSSSSSTTPSNSSSKEPTNPQTGMTGIVLAWIIGLLAIGYSFWYFKRTSTN